MAGLIAIQHCASLHALDKASSRQVRSQSGRRQAGRQAGRGRRQAERQATFWLSPESPLPLFLRASECLSHYLSSLAVPLA